jgi:hypothetical protein
VRSASQDASANSAEDKAVAHVNKVSMGELAYLICFRATAFA